MSRDQLILSLDPLARAVAWEFTKRAPPSVEYDDVLGVTSLEAVRVVRRFDPAAGNKLDTYARHRLRGAVLDYFRTLDPLGRDMRRAVRQGRAPASLGERVEFDEALEPRAGEARAGGLLPAELAVLAGELLAALTSRQRRCLVWYYGEGLTLREVGERLGITEAGAFYLHRRALARLRKRSGLDGEAP